VTTLGLGTLTNELLSDPRFGKLAIITSATTGNPALATIDLARADSTLALQYTDGGHQGAVTLKDIGEEVEQDHLLNTFDLAMIDPFHSYESSVECLVLAFNMLRPAGVLLVHDCLPPPEYTHPEFVEGNWCGTTFAAFRDLCTANGLSWFTVATDMGIGVAVKGPDPVERRAREGVWTEQTHDGYLARYMTEPCAFMQAVGGSDARTAVELALVGAQADHLRAPFAGWEHLIDRVHQSSDRSWQGLLEENRGLAAEVDSLTGRVRALGDDLEALDAQNRDLRAQVDQLNAHVVETQRPTWQARALLRSAPRAARTRIANRIRRTDQP